MVGEDVELYVCLGLPPVQGMLKLYGKFGESGSSLGLPPVQGMLKWVDDGK